MIHDGGLVHQQYAINGQLRNSMYSRKCPQGGAALLELL